MNCLAADEAKYQESLDRDHAIEMIEEDLLQQYDNDCDNFVVALEAGIEMIDQQDRVNHLNRELFRSFDDSKSIELMKELQEIYRTAINYYIRKLAIRMYEIRED